MATIYLLVKFLTHLALLVVAVAAVVVTTEEVFCLTQSQRLVDFSDSLLDEEEIKYR